MAATLSSPKSFRSVVAEAPGGGLSFRLGFDPAEVWGKRLRYRVGGTIDGKAIRAVVRADLGEVLLGPAWRRDCGVEPGDEVNVTLALEGPQASDLDDDFAAALGAEPEAAAFFDDLAQFYRKAYLTWIDGTKKRPDERARRIAETVKLLKAGVKTRPR